MCLHTRQNNSLNCEKMRNGCILFTGFSFVTIRGITCIQFTDGGDGTKYALKVINGLNVIFEVRVK